MRDLPIDLGQSAFRRRDVPGERSFAKNVLSLQIERLYLARSVGAHVFGQASRILIDKAIVSGNFRFLQGTCHLLLHGFTFPSTSHIFILWDAGCVASRVVARLALEALEDFLCTPGRFRRLA